MIARRCLLAAGGVALIARPRRAAATIPGVPPSGRLDFVVSRNGSRIGTHALRFSSDGADLVVAIDVHFRVGFGPITFYRYAHHGEERWRDGRFLSLDTQTDDNGRSHVVAARAMAGGVSVRATGRPDANLPAGAQPLTHWAVSDMHTTLFNPETGEKLSLTLEPKGPGLVDLASGAKVEATGYRLAGAAPIEDWYDDSEVWTALNASAQDGSRIEYRRS